MFFRTEVNYSVGEVMSCCVCACWGGVSHQWQQAGVEEDVALCNVHAADQLSQVGPVVQ